jgi:hypothetical protein
MLCRQLTDRLQASALPRYASTQIVELLASFERSGATLTTEEGMKSFLLLVSRMRSESLPSHETGWVDEIELIVLGLERK